MKNPILKHPSFPRVARAIAFSLSRLSGFGLLACAPLMAVTVVVGPVDADFEKAVNERSPVKNDPWS